MAVVLPIGTLHRVANAQRIVNPFAGKTGERWYRISDEDMRALKRALREVPRGNG